MRLIDASGKSAAYEAGPGPAGEMPGQYREQSLTKQEGIEQGPAPEQPLHPNCRCIMAPILIGDSENAAKAPSYEDWFNRQKEPVQFDILGPSRFALFKSGKIKVTQFSKNGNILSLKKLEEDRTTRKQLFEEQGVKNELSNPVKLIEPEHLAYEQNKSDWFFADHILNNPKAKRAVKGYTGDGKGYIGHAKINNAQLGKIPMIPAIREKVIEIEKLTEMYRLDKDIIVYRGTSSDYFSEMWEVGGTYSPKMFTSTSASLETAAKFAEGKDRSGKRPVLMEIRVAKGTKGFYIGDNTFYYDVHKEKQNEEEFVLGNAVKYTVISKEERKEWEFWVVEAWND